MTDWLRTEFSDFQELLHSDELVEEPVDVRTFLHDPYYLGISTVSDLQATIIDKASQIFLKHTLVRLYGEERGTEIWLNENPLEIVAQCGKGSGKDFSSRCAFLYTIYKLHCIRDPLGYYGKAHGTYIDLLNLAVNAEQAERVFFDPLKNMMKRSPWFNEQGFECKRKEVEFHSRPIRLFSGNSESEAWEGLDLMLVVLDEIAAFKTEAQFKAAGVAHGDQSRLSAAGIYKMSKLSVMSRFPDVGKVLLLSFPRYKGDFIQERYEKSISEPRVLRIKAKTWEMNPVITREQLQPEYDRNPIDARARFECEPPEMIDAFFRDPMRVRACFEGFWKTIQDGEYEKQVLEENHELFPINDNGTFKKWFKPVDDHPRFIHVDLAQKRDKAALAMCHSPGVRRIQTSYDQYEELPVVKMDLIHYWEAQPGAEIDFENIREFIATLCRRFPVALVTFDRWQSVDMIQALNRRGIAADMHSVKTNDYDTLATCFYDGRFRGYFNNLLVEEELLKLQVLPNRKIDHPNTGCFVGETRIPLLDGTSKQISELDGQEVWVYSATPEGAIVPGKARGRKTKEVTELIDITLDNGATVRCTPEHRFMLKDGSYKEAQLLRPGIDRVMPIKLAWPVNGGYERITDHTGLRTLTHKMVAEATQRPLLEGEIVHHKNENKTDNQPENLEITTWNEHSYSHTTERHESDLEYRKKLSEGTIRFNKLDSTRAKRSASMKARGPEWYLAKARVAKTFRSDITIEKVIECINSEVEATNANSIARILDCGRNVIIRVLRENGYENLDELSSVLDNNHKVRHINRIILDEPVPVYDLEVDEWNNFALQAGIIVHNSKDLADALAGATWNAIQFADIEAEIDIDVIGGYDEDVHDLELEDALEDDRNDKRVIIDTLYAEGEDDESSFDFRML